MHPPRSTPATNHRGGKGGADARAFAGINRVLPYAPFLPATIVATQVRQLTIAADLAINNNVTLSQG